MPDYGKPPPPPDCPSGLILWVPVAWYDDRIRIFRQDPTDPKKWRVVWDDQTSDAWSRPGGELMILQAKRRPAMVVSPEEENRDRQAVRIVPLLRTTEENAWYRDHEADIQGEHKPSYFWLDGVPFKTGSEPRVIDFAKAIRFPLAHVNKQERIALLSPAATAGIKRQYSKFIQL